MNWYLEVLKKYAVFSGRARRKEYWMFVLINLIIAFVLGLVIGLIENATNSNLSILVNIYQLAVLLPSIAVGVRRMHDTDHSGWWLLFPIVNLVFAVSKGTQGDNKYGSDPKAISHVPAPVETAKAPTPSPTPVPAKPVAPPPTLQEKAHVAPTTSKSEPAKPTPTNSNKVGKEEETRRGDGTILGDVISKGVYKLSAGSERIGYFNPEIGPFRTYPNGKTGLLASPMADQLIQIFTVTSETRELRIHTSEPGDMDIVVDLAVKLGLSSARQVMDTFQQLAKNESLSKFLMVTTTMPFFLTYSTGKVIVLAEVDLELKLNTLANLLLTDPSFSSVRSVSEFEAKGASLWDERKEEVEEKKQWAIDLQKSH